MADLGNLFFSLGLNDQEFNKKLEEAKKKALAMKAEIQKEQNQRIKDALKQPIEDYKEQQKRLRELQKSFKRQQEGEFKEYIQSFTTQSDASKQMSAYYKELEKSSAKAYQTVEGLNNALNQMKSAYSALNEEQKQSTIGKILGTQISDAETKLAGLNSQLKAGVGVTRAAGTQYNMLNAQIGMVARELPNLGISLSTFIISLSNNLPYLADAFAQANKEYNALKKAGETATPVWKQAISAILSWQTALIVGVTLLTAYSREIQAWVQGLMKGEEGVKKIISAEQQLALARNNGITGTIKEKTELEILYSIVKDVTRSTSQREAALRQLAKIQPQTFANTTKEAIANGKLEASYRALIEQIKAAAIARKYEDQIVSNSLKQEEILIKRRNQFVTYLKAQQEYNKQIRLNQLEGNTPEGRIRISEAKKNADKQKQIWENLVSEYNQYGDNIQTIQEHIDSLNLFPPPKEGTFEYWQQQLSSAETALKQFTDKQLNILNAASKSGKDLYSLGISKDLVDSYKKNISHINEAQKNLKLFDFSAKGTIIDTQKQLDDIQKAYNDLRDATIKGELEVQQTHINLMEDSSEKILAQIRLDYDKRIAEVQKYERDLILKYQKAEKETWEKANPNKKSGFKPKTTSFTDLSKDDQNIINDKYSLAFQQMEKDNNDVLKKMLDKYKDFAAQREAIDKEFNDDIAALNGLRTDENSKEIDRAIKVARNKYDEEIRRLESESLKLTSFYQKLFGDISDYGTNMLDLLISKTKDIISSAQANPLTKDGQTTGYTAMIDGKSIKLTEADLTSLIKKVKELENIKIKNNPFLRIKQGIQDYKKAVSESEKENKEFARSLSDANDPIEENVAIQKHQEKQAEINAEKQNALKQAIQGVAEAAAMATEVLDAWGNMFANLGNADLADALGLASELVGEFGKLAEDLTSGNPVQMITGALSFVPNIISSIAKHHDNKLNKVIEKSRLEVQRLQGAYEDLARYLDRQLGAVTERQAQQQLKNLEKQRSEISRQLAAERDKKNPDHSAIIDYQNQIKQLDDQIRYFYEDLAGEQFGIKIKDWAAQIADSLTNAFASGQDAASAFDDTVANIMKNVIKNILQLQYIEPAMNNLRTYLFGEDGKGGVLGDGELSQSDFSGLVSQLKGFKSIVSKSEEAWDYLSEAAKEAGINLEDSSSNEGLKKGIQGMTEKQADLLTGYFNSIRQDVSAMRQLLIELKNNPSPVANNLALIMADIKKIEINTFRSANSNDEILKAVNDINDRFKRATTYGTNVKFNL